MKKKEFIVLLKMKMRRKEFFTLWIGKEKTGEDSYFLTGDHVREKEPYLSESIIGAVYYPKDGHVIAPSLRKHSHILRRFPVLIYMNRQKYLISVLKIIK